MMFHTAIPPIFKKRSARDDPNLGCTVIAYIGLFSSALIAATILPMQSEAVLVGLLATASHPAAILIIVATVGNVLGSVINWYLGRFLL